MHAFDSRWADFQFKDSVWILLCKGGDYQRKSGAVREMKKVERSTRRYSNGTLRKEKTTCFDWLRQRDRARKDVQEFGWLRGREMEMCQQMKRVCVRDERSTLRS